jgi:hypothetical protein
MRLNAAARTVTMLGMGLAGLVGGHAFGYALAVPDDIHRTTLLAATGHGYLPSASRLAMMLGIAAVVTGIAAGYLHRPRFIQPSLSKVALRLVALQCAAFAVLEVVERVVASAPMSSLSVPLLVIGLLTQALVALVLALLIVGLRRLGAVLRTGLAITVLAGRDEPVVVATFAPFSRARLRDRVRGPPVLRMV